VSIACSCNVLDDSRKISGDYVLSKNNVDGPYYIFRSSETRDGPGLIEGGMRRIGWCDEYIWVQEKRAPANEVGQWVVISIHEDTLLRVVGIEELRRRILHVGCADSLWWVAPNKAWRMLE
jgi:hypothetical protein